jgi:hypothetical protein
MCPINLTGEGGEARPYPHVSLTTLNLGQPPGPNSLGESHYEFPADTVYRPFDTHNPNPRNRLPGRAIDIRALQAKSGIGAEEWSVGELGQLPGYLLAEAYQQEAERRGVLGPVPDLTDAHIIFGTLPDDPRLKIAGVLTSNNPITGDGLVIADRQLQAAARLGARFKRNKDIMPDAYSLQQRANEQPVTSKQIKARSLLVASLGRFLAWGDDKSREKMAGREDVLAFIRNVDPEHWESLARAWDTLWMLGKYRQGHPDERGGIDDLISLTLAQTVRSETMSQLANRANETMSLATIDGQEELVHQVRLGIHRWDEKRARFMDLLSRLNGIPMQDRVNALVEKYSNINSTTGLILSTTPGNKVGIYYGTPDGKMRKRVISGDEIHQLPIDSQIRARAPYGATASEMLESFFDADMPLMLGGISCHMFFENPDIYKNVEQDQPAYYGMNLMQAPGRYLQLLIDSGFFADGTVPRMSGEDFLHTEVTQPSFATIRSCGYGVSQVVRGIGENTSHILTQRRPSSRTDFVPSIRVHPLSLQMLGTDRARVPKELIADDQDQLLASIAYYKGRLHAAEYVENAAIASPQRRGPHE